MFGLYGMYVWYVCIISARALDAWRGCQVSIGGCGGVPPLLPELPGPGLNHPVVTDICRVCMYCMVCIVCRVCR